MPAASQPAPTPTPVPEAGAPENETVTLVGPEPEKLPVDEVMRRWLVGDASAVIPAPDLVYWAGARPDADPWLLYLFLDPEAPPEEREAALRALLERPIPDSLRHVVLRDIASDTRVQSRRARFIRRYGFYADWFNRVTYTTTRALQGNVQAFGQLVVDAAFGLFGRGRATPAERRLYRALRELEREGRATIADRERIAELQREIDRARAEVDVERAEFALAHGAPEMAEFYARGALGYAPGHKKAAELRRRAAEEIARRRRASVASAQVGYPDRIPPVEATDPGLLRSVLKGSRAELAGLIAEGRAGEPNEPVVAIRPESGEAPAPPDAEAKPEAAVYYPGDLAMAAMLSALGNREDAPYMALRERAAWRLADIPDAKDDWLRAAMLDPRFAPDMRLERAEAERRGQLARFIFVGPETARDKAYAASSRLAQAWQALGQVGLFYVFEVMYRAGVAAFSPPPPEGEAWDAAAAFLDAAPLHPRARPTARWLAEQYEKERRYDEARRLLARFDELTPEESARLNRAEARYLVALADALPLTDPRIAPLYERAAELAPGTGMAEKARERLAARREEGDGELRVRAAWEAVEQWSGRAPPAGLPGDPAWFDGQNFNGEVETGEAVFEAAGPEAETVTVRYPVRLAEGRRVVEEKLALADLPPELAAWLRHALADQARARREIEGLGRPRIPYEITGGAGLSGVDLYPRLLPIEAEPGDLPLYRD